MEITPFCTIASTVHFASLTDPCLPALRIIGSQFLLVVSVSLIMRSPTALDEKVLWL